MEVQTNSTSVDNVNIAEINELIQKESGFIDLINMEVKKVIVGQQHMIESLLIGLLSNGHILLEGVPGLAKTLAISTLSNIIDVDFKRVQFTPDLLPADLLGTMIYNQKKEEFISKNPGVTIIPGLVANVNIIRGRRSIIEYLWQPVAKIKDRAFRE